MVTKRTNKGQNIDMEALIAANKESPAVGNMKVNAAGDLVGPGGKVIQPNEDRVRAYYKDNPSSSTSQVSLKGPMPGVKALPDDNNPIEPKTAKTAKENKRTAKKKPKKPKEPSVIDTIEEVLEDKLEAIEKTELKVADQKELQPLGWREVAQPNGDIEMVPYYTEDDTDDRPIDDTKN